mgnify:CR=1 FL=1
MAESNRAEHQHKVEETPSRAILRHNKLSNNCIGKFSNVNVGAGALDFVCSIILAISTQFFLDNLADQCYNKKAEKLRKNRIKFAGGPKQKAGLRR